ncbi:CFEM domain-containing protein [Zymoseptoria brevis]|uniref:CFEM domain-containing protein n=1 Tax=Zymoseptoria brevis TaxID=1047168 RepID=A0A0F4GNI3_9PEZI|nr:CFEM domain-containing protein [Zymoseptoria brevis]
MPFFSLIALALGVVLATSPARAQLPNFNFTAAAELPQCVTSCGLQILGSFNCTIGDPCYCAQSGPMVDALTSCVIKACPSEVEALKGAQFQASSCGFVPHQDEGPRARAVLIAFLVLATLFFFARLASRWPQWGGAGYRWDDGVATICYLPIVASVVCGLVMVHYGMGQDVWTLPIPYVLHWAKWFVASQPIYIFAAYFTKLSLLLLYLRIWPEADSTNHNFRLLCKALSWFLSLAAFAALMATVIGCTILCGWRYNNTSCINCAALAYYSGSMNAVLDIVIIILPVPRLLALQITMKQKLGIISCFLVGLVVTACAIVRLTELHKLNSVGNATWDYLPFTLWCGIELCCSMICCCMPAMAGFLRRCFESMTAGKGSCGLSHGDSGLGRPQKIKENNDSDVCIDMASLKPIAARETP